MATQGSTPELLSCFNTQSNRARIPKHPTPMNTYQLFAGFNRSINAYLLNYSVFFVAAIVLFFLWWRLYSPTPFFRGLFYAVGAAGLLLGAAAANYRTNNAKSIEASLATYQQDKASFLRQQIQYASGGPARFYRLLLIWSVCMLGLGLAAFLLRSHPLVAGVCTGLVGCCAVSLLLDYVAYQRGADYLAALSLLR